MKTLNLTFIFFICMFTKINSQSDPLSDLLAAGIEDAQRFAEGYTAPASEGLVYAINNGWFNSAKPLGRLKFEISIVGNTSFVKDENTSFNLDTTAYQNISFADGNSSSRMVPTIFGASTSETVSLSYDAGFDVDGIEDTTIDVLLPGGIGTSEFSFIPSAFLQLGFSPLKGTELKARIAPNLTYSDAKVNAYGFGIQQDLLFWLPMKKILPIALSGVVAYTQLEGSYDLESSSLIGGDNQTLNVDVSSMLYQLVLGTNLKIINFYGSLGFVDGETKTELLGEYIITDSNTVSDPIKISNETSNMRTTLGTSLKFGFIGINVNYTFSEYDSANFGLNIGF